MILHQNQTRKPKTKDTSGDVKVDNIIEEGPSSRSTRSKTSYAPPKRGDKQNKYAMLVDTLHQNSAFTTTLSEAPKDLHRRLHRSQLPPIPRNYKEMTRHKYRMEFEAAAKREYEALWSKETFKTIAKLEATAPAIPLMWIYTYKFDTDGYLLKFKARLVARGDLSTQKFEDTYAATLATRVFRALMGIVA